jgi:chromosomal replication initiation ATPase DnaA
MDSIQEIKLSVPAGSKHTFVITIDCTTPTVNHLVNIQDVTRPSLAELLAVVAQASDCHVDELSGKCRKDIILFARYAYYVVAHLRYNYSCTAVARSVQRDHSTILTGIKTWHNLLDTQNDTALETAVYINQKLEQLQLKSLY